jgi:hypothetical protein
MAKEKEKGSTEGQAKIHAILVGLTESEKKLLNSVIAAERDKLYMQKPRGINDEVWKALTEIIR